jgi:hypothetical protein
MGKSTYLTVVLACTLSAFAVGCGDDDDDDGSGGSGGAGGKPTGGAGSGAADPDPPNPTECSYNNLPPETGTYARKGDCCYRKSNTARVDKSASTVVYEYRLNYFFLTNHPKNISPEVFGATQRQRADNEEQSLLFRFTFPAKDGKIIDGDGKLKIGSGRYNCDGTYSFYSKTAAPSQGANGKADRWYSDELKTKVDATKTNKDRVKVAYKDSLPVKNKDNFAPYLAGGDDFSIDWEGQSQGFDILEMPSGDEEIDCVGSREDNTWKPRGKTVAFGRVDGNNTDVINAVNINFCQLMGFGPSIGAMASDPKYKCDATPRCTPGDGDCVWTRLPDSLCPTSDDDRGKWGCHLGSDINEADNKVKAKCSMDKPTNVNPDEGTDEGQCCDPLGKDTDGLPACNAWMQVNEFVAAAAEITDDLADKQQESCKQ